jgi:hypothetical protein
VIHSPTQRFNRSSPTGSVASRCDRRDLGGRRVRGLRAGRLNAAARVEAAHDSFAFMARISRFLVERRRSFPERATKSISKELSKGFAPSPSDI